MKTRQRAWARATGSWLATRQVRPNWISIAGVAAAGLGAVCLALVPHAGRPLQAALLLLAAGLVPLRLLANMLDGLVAVEGGLRSPVGELFNEIPDRISDAVLLVAAGYAIPANYGPALGWLVALLAVGTAYVRLLGGSLGLKQDFGGPLAKPQRMVVLIVACLASIGEVAVFGYQGLVMTVALAILAAGTAVTLVRRTRRIAGGLARP